MWDKINHFRNKMAKELSFFHKTWPLWHSVQGILFKEISQLLHNGLHYVNVHFTRMLSYVTVRFFRSSGSNARCLCWWLEEAMLNFKENEWEGNVTRVTTEPADPKEKEDAEAADVIYYDKTAQCIGKFGDVHWCKFQHHLSPVSLVLHKLN